MTSGRLELPPGVRQFAARGPEWARFVDSLPMTLEGLLAQWDLAADGAVLHGECAVVLPVRTRDDVEAALKVGFVDPESAHEHLTLDAWGGQAAVELLRADPRRGALLIERAGPDHLTTLPVLRACEVVGQMYGRLHVTAPHRLPLLSGFVATWSESLAERADRLPVPRRLAQQALALGRSFVDDPEADGIAVHTDLHDENVLASRRSDGPTWLAIDPKGVSGDPHYEPAPMLWNRWAEAVATGDVRTAVRRRFHTLVDVAGLDEDRARDWVVVRMLHNALWAVEDAEQQRRPLDASDRDWITRCISIAKAVQD